MTVWSVIVGYLGRSCIATYSRSINRSIVAGSLSIFFLLFHLHLIHRRHHLLRWLKLQMI